MIAKKKQDTWRDELYPPEDFKCACGCELQLSRGDMADAIRAALPFAGQPRLWGIDLARRSNQQRVERAEEPEPVESQPCPKCGDPVELPVFAAKLLETKKAAWPTCASCRKPSTAEAPDARQYWG
jgi:hypothetical protein